MEYTRRHLMQYCLHLTRIGAVQPEIREQHNQVINSSAVLWDAATLGPEGLLRLASQPVLLLAVAGREVERDKSGNACSLRDVTSLTRSKMSPLCGNISICIEERRLNKELVGTARERDDSANILLAIGGVHHVSDLLSRRGAQRVLLEHAQRDG